MKNKKFFASCCLSSKKGAENISKQRQNMGSKETAAMSCSTQKLRKIILNSKKAIGGGGRVNVFLMITNAVFSHRL